VESERQSLIGKKISRYELREVIGEGGMATVFRAYDTYLEREVGLKLFRHEAFSPIVARRMLKRFDREAKALAKLSHPNIVEVLDYGSYRESLYLVMKYLSGGTLRDKVQGKIDFREAVKYLVPIAYALDHAHKEGIVHRDVKPANILFSKTGDPMLSDFGIAKVTEDEKSVTLTATNVGVGTPEYMAPEQWINQVSPRSDIYALGMVFYELVTGIKPYISDTPTGVAIRQATEPLPNPRQFSPTIPEQAVSVILKALANRPEDRYQSMSDFAVAMEGLNMLDAPALEEEQKTTDDMPVVAEENRRASAEIETRRMNRQETPLRKQSGPLNWFVTHLLLTLVLGGLIIFATLLSVSGVINWP
jgi:eukaryotic-like serine/threonine-protein kinase